VKKSPSFESNFRRIQANWAAGTCTYCRPSPCVAKQPNNQLPGFEPRVVIGAGIDDGAFHHKRATSLKRVVDNGQHLVEHSADPVAARLEQLSHKNARARRVRFAARLRARHAELPRDRRRSCALGRGQGLVLALFPAMIHSFGVVYQLTMGSAATLKPQGSGGSLGGWAPSAISRSRSAFERGRNSRRKS
jgi:hypothetical protein